MATIEITTGQFAAFTIALNTLIGVLLGLIPLLFGRFNKQIKLGVWGIVSTTIGGAILGVFLSIPSVIVFTWLIARATQKEVSSKDSASSGSPNEE